jgi:hypothetical protein
MGLRGKRGKDKTSIGWVKDICIGLMTKEKIESDWNALTPAERVKTWSTWVPKDIANSNNGLQINLILRGVEPKSVITAHVVDPRALTDGDNDDS